MEVLWIRVLVGVPGPADVESILGEEGVLKEHAGECAGDVPGEDVEDGWELFPYDKE